MRWGISAISPSEKTGEEESFRVGVPAYEAVAVAVSGRRLGQTADPLLGKVHLGGPHPATVILSPESAGARFTPILETLIRCDIPYKCSDCFHPKRIG